jgi:hypothetical protein
VNLLKLRLHYFNTRAPCLSVSLSQALKHLRLDRQVPVDRLKDLQAVLQPGVLVSLD